jgi:hypothetical protein
MNQKNFLKKLLCLILIVAMGFSMNIPIAAANEELPDDSASTPAIYLEQAEALEAYSVLYSTFSVDNDGYVTYPDDYAGAWIKDNKLFIAIASPANAKTIDVADSNKYKDLLSDYDCVVYKTVEHSLYELDAIRHSVFDDLKDEYSVISHYVDVEENKISLGFLEYEESSVLNSLETLATETNALSRILSNIDTDIDFNFSDLFILRKDELIDAEASLYGGMEINRGSSSGPGRSIGVCGTFTTSGGTTHNGIVTAGHNLAVSGTNQTLYRGGSEFGKVSLLMWQDGASGDWASVRLTNSDTLTNKIYGSSTGFTRNITGTLDDLPKGTALMKFGFSSGYAEATVDAQDETRIDGSGYTINGLTRATLTSGTSDGGDSGGPYYTQSSAGGNSYNFVGIHWGSNAPSGGSSILFTPYVRFKSRFTVKTN